MDRKEAGWRPIWRRVFSPRQMREDIEDEIAFHIEGKVDALVSQGMTEGEAREEALRLFGNQMRIKAEMAAASRTRIKRKKREVTVDSILRDLRYAARQITRNPGFSFLLTLTIAVAVGGNVAIFSVLEGIVLRPLPYPEPEELVAVWNRPETEDWRQPFSGPDYLDVRAQIQGLEDVGAIRTSSFNVAGEGEPTRVQGSQCTASILKLLGVPPLHGRFFEEENELEGNQHVVVLSHGLWQTRYAGDPGIIGQTVLIDGAPHEILGVMPEGFRSPTPWGGRDNARFWVPLVLPRDGSTRGSHWIGSFGRLADGVSIQEAGAELEVIAAQLAEEYPDTNARTNMFLEPMMARTLGSVQSAVLFLVAIVGLVLLIACANVGSMLLARGMNRAPEFAVRASVGAGKKGIVGQLLTESLLLAALGGGVGIALAYWGVDAIRAVMPEDIPRAQLIQVNLKVLGFAVLVTGATGLLVGLAPALFLTRSNLAEVIKHGRASRGGGRSKLLSGLVAAQLAMGFVLVNSAVLLVASYRNVMNQDHNFATEKVLVAYLPLAGPDYEEFQDRQRYYDEVLERTRALPEVVRAGLTAKLPLRGGSNGGVLVKDEVYDPSVHTGLVEYTFIGEDYHETMGIRLLAGRTLERRDMDESAVTAERDTISGEYPIVINRAMAERYWPDEDPLGQVVRPNWREAYFRATVVGVVEDVRQWGAERDAVPEMFFPYTGRVWGAWDQFLTVQAAGDPEALAPTISEIMQEADPNIPRPSPYTMARVLEEQTAGRRFSMLLVGLFALTALLLIISGTYGVVSYAVTERTHEIGVRMTLGADKSKVARLFLRRLGYLVVPGLAVGTLGAFGAARITRSMVYGISAMNPIFLGAAAAVMILVALSATIVPVTRATGVDPLDAMRVD